MAVWIYKLAANYQYKSTLLNNISFDSEWGNIRDGVLTIYKGYAWDGCTPKVKVYKDKVIGIWDGWDMDDGKPVCYYASLVHDFFCQYSSQIKIKRKDTISIFSDMLRDRKWPFTPLYVGAIWLFSPRDFAGDK